MGTKSRIIIRCGRRAAVLWMEYDGYPSGVGETLCHVLRAMMEDGHDLRSVVRNLMDQQEELAHINYQKNFGVPLEKQERPIFDDMNNMDKFYKFMMGEDPTLYFDSPMAQYEYAIQTGLGYVKCEDTHENRVQTLTFDEIKSGCTFIDFD